MKALIGSFYLAKTHRARQQQILTALQMLSASGVIRPGHVEPDRYEQTTRINASSRKLLRPKTV